LTWNAVDGGSKGSGDHCRIGARETIIDFVLERGNKGNRFRRAKTCRLARGKRQGRQEGEESGHGGSKRTGQ